MSAPAAFVAAVALAIVGYVAYRGLGALTGDVETTAAANAERIDRVQRALGIDVERAVQTSWLATGVTGDLLAWFYTFGYWPSIAAAIVATAVYDRRVLRRLAAAFALSGAVGLVVITVFPLAPPRLVGGADDHVARSDLLSALAHPSAVFNPYAAMPSFHVAWTVLAALAGSQFVRAHRLAGAAMWSVPATMSIAVVTTGNHWVLDVAAGAVLAAGAWWGAPHLLGVLRRNIRTTPTPRMRDPRAG